MEIPQLYKLFQQQGAVSTDTRKISRGCIFFTLKGENFDGNDFIEDALLKGAAWVVADNPKIIDDRIIKVDDPLSVLQRLATYHRRSSGVRILAITGSNGKTTTKELCRAVLSEKYPVFATEGNLNNHIGVPLTLLSIKNTEVGIVEMGANHPGEIAFLCRLAEPDYGLITNIGKAHLEGFGGQDGVAKAKGELFEYLISANRIVLVNQGDPLIMKLAAQDYQNTVYYNGPGGVRALSTGSGPFLEFEACISGKTFKLKTNLIGKYNIENVLAACMVGISFGIEIKSIQKAIEGYLPAGHRSQLINTPANRIFMDSYNANPSSMAAALNEFISMEGNDKMMILGEMAEIGPSSASEHEKILTLIRQKGFNDSVVCVGKEFREPAKNAGFLYFENADKLSSYLTDHPLKGKFIFIKGSRINRLEKLLDCL